MHLHMFSEGLLGSQPGGEGSGNHNLGSNTAESWKEEFHMEKQKQGITTAILKYLKGHQLEVPVDLVSVV